MATLKPAANPALSQAEALTVLEWVFGAPKGELALKAADMTKEDRGYAQAMLVELINASLAMGMIEALFRAGMKPSSTVKQVIVGFAKGAGKTLLKFKDKDDLAKFIKTPTIYESVLASLARNMKSAWAIRLNTGAW